MHIVCSYSINVCWEILIQFALKIEQSTQGLKQHVDVPNTNLYILKALHSGQIKDSVTSLYAQVSTHIVFGSTLSTLIFTPRTAIIKYLPTLEIYIFYSILVKQRENWIAKNDFDSQKVCQKSAVRRKSLK